MQLRTLVLIALALACGIVASIGVANVVGGKAESLESEPVTRIYVALRDLSDGELFDERNVRLAQWPTRGLPPGSIEQIDQLKSRQVSGRIPVGQPIQLAQIKAPPAVNLVVESDPEPRLVTIEVPRDSTGPWIVSTGERPLVAPLSDVWRQAVELAKRAAPDPVEPVQAAEPTIQVEPIAPASPAVTSPLPAAPQATELAESSSIVTPEGPKVLPGRKSNASPLADIQVHKRSTRVTTTGARLDIGR